MPETLSAPVVIVGAGPVGLCLALDLASHGVGSIVAERSPAGANETVRCNHVSSRTMETFRRLGFASEVRAVGLPDDYPNDVVVRTQATGRELTRIPIPCRRDRFTKKDVPDGWWPTAEPPHRVNQIFFEPILLERALASPLITLINDVEVTDFTEAGDAVICVARNTRTGQSLRLAGQYLVGCDGGGSTIRKKIGAVLEGDAVIQRVQSTYFRAPELLGLMKHDPAWMSYLYIGNRAGNLVAIDGKETWLLHNYLLPQESDFGEVDRDYWLRALLGVDEEFHYEIIRQEDWIGRRLVADKFRTGRAFICGDASHLWVPYAGYGMNAGIADAMNLSWQLAATINGWASPAILDAYEAERHPITDQVSRYAMSHAQKAIAERQSIPAEVDSDGPEAEAMRARIGAEAYALHVQQFACAGLNFGYFYPASPIIAYDGASAPAYTMYDYTPSTVPGCRTPHFLLADGTSLYDRMGSGYTLLVLEQDTDIAALVQAASRAGLPLTVLDLTEEAPPAAYEHALLLSRPDCHVAWRGHALPADVDALVARLSGHAQPALALAH
ncbi:FAD-dependent oxidoreductase [Novosphingobium taihuense]|uniref:2-polyprenyl-6-methoxyphenol hydroxylase-like FAD-dependent oxidoreductase n=1 Tax=Novosphingobium taihuense TaxID=260085 RepID=A0A7W7ABW2_9SPHN|nr:FAD-dependent oxidoreductase [Novosphingobium taihuense]MBB4614183.1 2-polyprenyl-6-methoxyphenol hydroxylase-like FAD-dependent oxidoreductase [Novosphingobium taihuense]TWH87032.1 2-polyprenyl-6-methoxyphenol hydroxylase-like FAD-dependent oxidoreductase [Novosphingobium taihuense]